MANSGIEWVDVTFNWCVWLLYEASGLLGITYEEINIWLFVIIGPALFESLIYLGIFIYLGIYSCGGFAIGPYWPRIGFCWPLVAPAVEAALSLSSGFQCARPHMRVSHTGSGQHKRFVETRRD